MNATGMSRPIAPEGTIRYSTSAALAAVVPVHTPTANIAAEIIRSINPRAIPHLTSRLTPLRVVVNHITAGACSETTDGGDPRRGSPPSAFFQSLRGGRRAQRPLDVRLHLLQLRAPVAPAVGAGVREVEHPILAAVGEIGVAERDVGALREALEELRVEQVARARSGVQVGRVAVTAVDPDAGVVVDQLLNVDHRVV